MKILLLLLLLLVGCKDDDKRPPYVPPPIQQGGWTFSFGVGAGDLVVNGDDVSFTFNGAEPHMLLKSTGPLAGTVHLHWRCEDCQLVPVQGTVPTISLIIVRNGNNWTATGPQVSYRWYHAGDQLSNAEGTMDVPLTLEHWGNVLGGRTDAAGFLDALANAAYIGVAFGDTGAGATAHGIKGTGRLTYTFKVN